MTPPRVDPLKTHPRGSKGKPEARYRIGEPVGYEWLQAMIVGGALVPDDTLQQIADAWEATVGSGYIKDNIRHLAPELAALLDGLNDE